MDGDIIVDARICLGAVYPTPVRASDAEDSVLIGKAWSDDLLEQAGRRRRLMLPADLGHPRVGRVPARPGADLHPTGH